MHSNVYSVLNVFLPVCFNFVVLFIVMNIINMIDMIHIIHIYSRGDNDITTSSNLHQDNAHLHEK